MKRKSQRVVVEVSFDVPVTEKEAVWKLKYKLLNDKVGLMFGPQINTVRCKEFKRVAQKLYN